MSTYSKIWMGSSGSRCAFYRTYQVSILYLLCRNRTTAIDYQAIEAMWIYPVSGTKLGLLTYRKRCDMLNTDIQWEVSNMATSIRLAPEIEERLDSLASQTGRTKAFYLRQIIEQGIEDMEDYYLAADALERIRQGKERVYTLDEVERDLGLED